jgi:flagellar biosynthesis/type III secretory pathway M-ring protein FliF/YscJ
MTAISKLINAIDVFSKFAADSDTSPTIYDPKKLEEIREQMLQTIEGEQEDAPEESERTKTQWGPPQTEEHHHHTQSFIDKLKNLVEREPPEEVVRTLKLWLPQFEHHHNRK